MPTINPPQPATISGDNITVNRLINAPAVLQRTLRTLVQQRLVGDRILTGRIDLTGTGAVNYEVSEAIMMADLAQRVAPMAEYPLTTSGTAASAMANTEKWALGFEISDELIARNRIDVFNRNMIKLANRLAFGFDALILSAVGSAVTQTYAAAAAWSATTAQPFADVVGAAAVADTLNQGYDCDICLCTPTKWAQAISASGIIDRAPRESDNSLLLTGRIVTIAGFTFIKTTNLPSGVSAMVVDSTQLGTIGWEDLGGGYLGTADGVQTKRYRLEGNDGWRINGRRVGVPLVQEPGCAVKITGV